MLSYKMKNYVLVGYDGEMKFKGSSLVSRSSERFGRRFVRRCVRLILDDDIDGLHGEYLDVRRRISGHEWTEAIDFARVETIKERLSDYTTAVESGTRLQSAAYEVALELSRRGQRVRKGDRITYYVARSNKPARLFESARPIDDWDPSSPDEDTRYYLRRLDEFASKFEVFFAPTDFRRVFSEEDLFGFSAEGIAIRSGETVATI
jgi:DNA polymerase elongation subunit (family B)